MEKEAFLRMNIEEQVQLINNRTGTGLKVSDVAGELGMGDKALRRILRKKNYIYSRVDKGYLLNKITAITKEESKENSKAIKIQQAKGTSFSNEEIKGLKELLAIKESLLKMETTTRNNQTITVMDISNIDKSHREKAKFNMDKKLWIK